jgi:hypothetical protein
MMPDATPSAAAVAASSAAAGNRHAKERTRRSNTAAFSISKMLAVVLVALVVLLSRSWSLHGVALAPASSSQETVACEQLFLDGSPMVASPVTKAADQNNNNNNNNNTTPSSSTESVPLPASSPHRHSSPPPSMMPRTNTTSNVVYFVFSRHDAFAVRQTIRATWARRRHRDNDNVFFVIGRPCWIPPKRRGTDLGGNEACTVAPKPLNKRFVRQAVKYKESRVLPVEAKISEEMKTYQDVLQMEDHIYDSYGSLPDKLKAAYSFVYYQLPSTVDFVVKVNDDFFVRIDEFTQHVNDNYRHLVSVPTLIGGRLLTDHQAFTDGKWREMPQHREGTIYPPFPMGSYGHVVTRPIFEYVATHKELLFNYQGEDNSLGIWIKQSPTFDFANVTYINSPVMAGDGNCLVNDKYLVGHYVDQTRMVACQLALRSTTRR